MKIGLIIGYILLSAFFMYGYTKVGEYATWIRVVVLLASPILCPFIILLTLGLLVAYAPFLLETTADKAQRDTILRHLY